MWRRLTAYIQKIASIEAIARLPSMVRSVSMTTTLNGPSEWAVLELTSDISPEVRNRTLAKDLSLRLGLFVLKISLGHAAQPPAVGMAASSVF